MFKNLRSHTFEEKLTDILPLIHRANTVGIKKAKSKSS